MKHPIIRLRLGDGLFWAAGIVCLVMMLASAADAWAQFQITRAVVAAELGRMP